VCSPCVEKIIRKEMIDPLCGKAMQESDLIELQRGGTGYAATNELKARLIRPQLELQWMGEDNTAWIQKLHILSFIF